MAQNPGLGSLEQLLDAQEAQETAVKILDMMPSGTEGMLTAYTMDREELGSAVIRAWQRGCQISVVLDERSTLRGNTRDQPALAKRMIHAGVPVYLAQGKPLGPEYRAAGRGGVGFGNLSGQMHAKMVWAHNRAVVGSTNWTTSSRANVERSTLLVLSAKGIEEFQRDARDLLESARSATEAMVADAQRTRSQSPSLGRQRSVAAPRTPTR